MAVCSVPRKHKLLLKHGPECVWCSQGLTVKTMTVDHVICVSMGGTNWFGNLLPACSDCNVARGNISAGTWLRKCLREGKTVKEDVINKVLQRSRSPEQIQFYIANSNQPSDLENHQQRMRRMEAHQRMNAALEALLGPSFYVEKAIARSLRQQREVEDRLGLRSLSDRAEDLQSDDRNQQQHQDR